MRTRDRLAKDLRKVGNRLKPRRAAFYEALAVRAETGEFDDFSDVHVCGPTALWQVLTANGCDKFAKRVAEGEFDATLEESEEWARSQTDPQTVAIMNTLGIGPDRSKDS